VKRAYDIAGGKGAININVLWEMGGAQRVLEGVLERPRACCTGVTCGAGMPYKLSEIAQRYNVTTCRSSARPRLPRAVEARLFTRCRMAGGGGL
jgi:nitronate monooxygenase